MTDLLSDDTWGQDTRLRLRQVRAAATRTAHCAPLRGVRAVALTELRQTDAAAFYVEGCKVYQPAAVREREAAPNRAISRTFHCASLRAVRAVTVMQCRP